MRVFGFSIPETAADAQEAVRVTRREARAGKDSVKGEHHPPGRHAGD